MKLNSTLRPGLLVSLKTGITGNALYARQDVESPHYLADGKLKAKWETEKIVEDPAEYTEAQRIRSKAANRIRNVCVQSAFGLICPEAQEAKLDEAMGDARDFIDNFNSNAKLTRLSLYILVGRIASNDAEAVRAINSEVKSLLDKMEQGLKSFDVKTIREAAEQARQVGQMLPSSSREEVRKAIDAARAAANRINKAGDAAAIEIDQQTLAVIKGSRLMFLDLSEQSEEDERVSSSIPSAPSRSLDLAAAE